jgi:hypothetical protein
MPITLSQRLARFVVDLSFTELPAHVIDKAKACVLHFLGVGIESAQSWAALVAQATVEREEAQRRHGFAICPGRGESGLSRLYREPAPAARSPRRFRPDPASTPMHVRAAQRWPYSCRHEA